MSLKDFIKPEIGHRVKTDDGLGGTVVDLTCNHRCVKIHVEYVPNNSDLKLGSVVQRHVETIRVIGRWYAE